MSKWPFWKQEVQNPENFLWVILCPTVCMGRATWPFLPRRQTSPSASFLVVPWLWKASWERKKLWTTLGLSFALCLVTQHYTRTSILVYVCACTVVCVWEMCVDGVAWFISDCVWAKKWMCVSRTQRLYAVLASYTKSSPFQYCVAVFLSGLIVSYQFKSETELCKKQIQTLQGPARSHAGVLFVGHYFPPFMSLFLPLSI